MSSTIARNFFIPPANTAQQTIGQETKKTSDLEKGVSKNSKEKDPLNKERKNFQNDFSNDTENESNPNSDAAKYQNEYDKYQEEYNRYWVDKNIEVVPHKTNPDNTSNDVSPEQTHFMAEHPLPENPNTEEPVTFGPGNDKGEFDARQIQEMRHNFSDEQINELMELSPPLKNRPEILNDFLNSVSSSVRAQYGNSKNADISELTYEIALEFVKGEVTFIDKTYTFNEAITGLYDYYNQNSAEENKLEKWVRSLTLIGKNVGNYSFVENANEIIQGLSTVFPNSRRNNIDQMPQLVKDIAELNTLLSTKLYEVAKLEEGSEAREIALQEIYDLRDLIDEKMERFAEILEIIVTNPRYQDKVPAELRAKLMELAIGILDVIDTSDNKYHQARGRSNTGLGNQDHRSGRGLRRWLMNQLKKDKEAAMLLSASAKETLQKLMPEMLATVLEANHSEELSLALSLIQQNQKYAQYTIDDVMKRIIEYSNKIAEFIKAKNEQINLEELLNEKRNEFAELEIFNLPEPVLKTISDILGINAKYLDPAKLRAEIEKMQIKVA